MKIEKIVKEWLEASDARKLVLSHGDGGIGSRFYVTKEDDGEVLGDGVGETIEATLEDAFVASH